MNETCFLANELRGPSSVQWRQGREQIRAGKDCNDDEAGLWRDKDVECGAGPPGREDDDDADGVAGGKA